MPYCITLRSKNEASVAGWYVESDSRWSTDHKRRKLFDKVRDARPVCYELRRLCPRNAEVINMKAVQDDLSLRILPAGPGSRSSIDPVNARKVVHHGRPVGCWP